MDPIHWFLDGKEDVRSSFYLEDVATEFHVQGLELDWSCITWDADFRYNEKGWETFSFVGDKWHHIKKQERKQYLKNAYRVLLTRARQGMIIVVPTGEKSDATRLPTFYDSTYDYLTQIGLKYPNNKSSPFAPAVIAIIPYTIRFAKSPIMYPTVQVCDARMPHSTATARYIKKSALKNYGFGIIYHLSLYHK